MKLCDVSALADELDTLLLLSGGEVSPELQAKLDTFALEEGDSITSYVLWLKAKEAEQAAFEAKRKYYQDLANLEESHAKAIEGRLKWHKSQIKAYMEGRGVSNLKGSQGFGFRIQPNGGRPAVEVLVAPQDLPRAYVNVTVTADKDALRFGLISGAVTEDMARFAPVGTSLRAY
jgi:hypothetical protein